MYIEPFCFRTSINLVVKYSPVVTITSNPSKLMEGDKVTFTCTAKTNPGIKSYLWFEENVPLIGSRNVTYVVDKIG